MPCAWTTAIVFLPLGPSLDQATSRYCAAETVGVLPVEDPVDQAGLGRLGRQHGGALHQFEQVRRFQAAFAGHGRGHLVERRAEQALGLLPRRFGHAGLGEHLGRGLVRAQLRDVRRDAQLGEHPAQVQALAAQAAHLAVAAAGLVDRVAGRRQVERRQIEGLGPGVHRFAAVAHRLDPVAQFLELGPPGALEGR